MPVEEVKHPDYNGHVSVRARNFLGAAPKDYWSKEQDSTNRARPLLRGEKGNEDPLAEEKNTPGRQELD